MQDCCQAMLQETLAMTELGSSAAEQWKLQKTFMKSGWGVKVLLQLFPSDVSRDACHRHPCQAIGSG